MAEEPQLRERLRLVIQSSASEVWSPWYVLGHVPEEQAEMYAEVALRRWKSRERRSLGRRDPVRDLAKGFSESRALHPPGDGPVAADEKNDYEALAEVLVVVLRDR